MLVVLGLDFCQKEVYAARALFPTVLIEWGSRADFLPDLVGESVIVLADAFAFQYDGKFCPALPVSCITALRLCGNAEFANLPAFQFLPSDQVSFGCDRRLRKR